MLVSNSNFPEKKILINPPPVSHKCEVCLKEADLRKTFREEFPFSTEFSQIGASWECHDCLGLSDEVVSLIKAGRITIEQARSSDQSEIEALIEELKNVGPEFPVRRPTHYLACLYNYDISHAAVRLSAKAITELIKNMLISKLVGVFGEAALTRYRSTDQVGITFHRYIRHEHIEDDMPCSTDKDPYSCLSLGELADVGGYCDENILKTCFEPIDDVEETANAIRLSVTDTGMAFLAIEFEKVVYESDLFEVMLLARCYWEQLIQRAKDAWHQKLGGQNGKD